MVRFFGVGVNRRGISFDRADLQRDAANLRTGLQAAAPLPGTQVDDRARAKVRQTAENLRRRGNNRAALTLDIIGPSQSTGGAVADVALSALPFGKPGRGAVRAAERYAARRSTGTAGRTIRRVGSRTTQKATTPARVRNPRTRSKAASTTPTKRTATPEPRTPAPGRTGRSGRTGRAGRFLRSPVTIAAAAGVGGGYLIGTSANRGTGGYSDPRESGGGGGGGGGGNDGPGFTPQDGGFLGFEYITAGLGSAFDRIGGGIADLMAGIGIPIGEGAGKAIAIGGTMVLGAIAISTLATGTATASVTKAKAKATKPKAAKPSGSARYKPVKGNPKVMLDKASGKFVSKAKVSS